MRTARRFIATLVVIMCCSSVGVDGRAQGWNSDQTASVERREIGTFDKKPVFQRTLISGEGADASYRIEIFWADEPDAIRKKPSQAKRSSGELELAKLEEITVLLSDEGKVGAYPNLMGTTLDAPNNRLELVDWPPVSAEPPYAVRRTRVFDWDRKGKRFKLESTERFWPKLDRMKRLAGATETGEWDKAWRAALALDPFVATSQTPGCDRLVGLATLDLLIAHLDSLLEDGKPDDAHRVLSLAFRFGGPRAAGCGLTSSGVESKMTAAFADGAEYRLENVCSRDIERPGGKAACSKGAAISRSWKSPEKTRQALLSFAEFAAARGDLELVKRLMSGMVEVRYHDPDPPEGLGDGDGALQNWAWSWAWLGDSKAEQGYEKLAAAAHQLALEAKDSESLSRDELDRLRRSAAGFEPQKVDPKEIGETLGDLIERDRLLLAIGEAERYSRADLTRASIDAALIRKPVIASVEKKLEALKKADEGSDELADWRALRGKARWLNPMAR